NHLDWLGRNGFSRNDLFLHRLWPAAGLYTPRCLHCALATFFFLLARCGELPLRTAQFLDWAHSAGLMRMAGIAVQFRHREFQEWLTRAQDATAPAGII
ncbi:MAG: hypothetical protein ACRDQ5_23015, partial [Sciscionella sp.]